MPGIEPCSPRSLMENMDGIGTVKCVHFLYNNFPSKYEDSSTCSTERGLILSHFQCEFHAAKSLSLGNTRHLFLYLPNFLLT